MLAMLVSEACSPASEPPEGVVATVDGVEIRGEDLAQRFWSGSREERQRSTARGGRHFLLDLVIGDALLYREATRRWAGPSFSVAEPHHEPLMERFLREEFEPTVSPSQVSRRDIEREYERTKVSMREPPRRHLRQIAVSTEARARELRDRAVQAFASADEDTLYELIFGRPGEELEGIDGLFDERETETYFGREIAEAAFSTNEAPRCLDQVFHTGATWSVIIVREAFAERPPPPLSEVEDGIRDQLFSELRERALDAWVDEFRGRHRVEVHADLLSLVPWSRALEPPPSADAGASPVRGLERPDGGSP